jgi:cation:H+ antiporter
MWIDLLYIVVSLVMLIAGAEGLVRGSSSLALRIGLTPLTVGLTVVAFGTSSPELVVSLKAGLAGQGDISVGNVVGSNIFNIAVILGITAVVCPIPVQWQLIKIDGPIMAGMAILMVALLWDGSLSRAEGFLLTAGIVAYTTMNVKIARRQTNAIVQDEMEDSLRKPAKHWAFDLLYIVGGLAVLVIGSRFLVDHSTSLALQLGVSEAVIGLTIVAAGTSMPELATSVVAALRKQPDIAIGNVIGSTVFNILGILGITALATPIETRNIRPADYGTMLGVCLLVLPLLFTGRRLERWEGALLLACYGVYLWFLWPKG